ncbi:hypothetical protein AAG906_032947 [Vitis piasezkii]
MTFGEFPSPCIEIPENRLIAMNLIPPLENCIGSTTHQFCPSPALIRDPTTPMTQWHWFHINLWQKSKSRSTPSNLSLPATSWSTGSSHRFSLSGLNPFFSFVFERNIPFCKKEEKAQAVAERIKVAALTTAKGLSRVQAERAATTAARNVNAYGQKEEDPCRWQEMGADNGPLTFDTVKTPFELQHNDFTLGNQRIMSNPRRKMKIKTIDLVKKYNAQFEDKVIAIMLDTTGLEVRSGDVPKPIMLKEGQEFYFTIKEESAQKTVSVNYDDFVNDVEVGDILLVNGGMMRCLNVRGKRATLPSITDKNWEDIKFGVDNQVDFYVVSFVKDAEVVHELKDYLKICGADIHVTVKIESADSIPNLHSIISSSDGKIMGTFWREREGFRKQQGTPFSRQYRST